MHATQPSSPRHRAGINTWICAIGVAAVAILAGCADDGASVSPTPPTAGTVTASTANPSVPPSSVPMANPDDATAYCTTQGGTVEIRHPYLDTNLDRSDWVQLPGSMQLCRFESDDADASRLYIDVQSVAATVPSLADAAYLAKLPLPSTSGGANPATTNCINNVGGAASFGTSANGGGWVNLDDPTFTVVDLCVFSDGSAIDQWAIAYYSGGVTRGADLATIFRFDPATAGAIFPPTGN